MQAVVIDVLWAKVLAVDYGMGAAIDINGLNAAPIIAANVANSSGRKPGEVFQKPGKAGLIVLGIGPVRQLQLTKPRRVAHRFVKSQLVQPQLGFEELLGLGVELPRNRIACN